ncbi:hypothetical protein LSH36_441g00023 [Paralvinella palmiformis]|uniref:Uncharacterized protein n=1 Tax=Paralvinella palmiformis TaxID=53620 RepID=A0AAD9JBL2_9ANNE|nr:hypothetical protein LSH36_441g00023 [Paralvinella palmiformis]
MLPLIVVAVRVLLAVRQSAAVPSELCTAERLGRVLAVVDKRNGCELCKCSDADSWVCIDVGKLQIHCRTPTCDQSRWEPDPTALCCFRCRKEATCRLGEVSHPCPDDRCFECLCQDILGIPTMTCSDVSSECPKLLCTEKQTPDGQCCSECVTKTTSTTTETPTARQVIVSVVVAALLITNDDDDDG